LAAGVKINKFNFSRTIYFLNDIRRFESGARSLFKTELQIGVAAAKFIPVAAPIFDKIRPTNRSNARA